MYYKLPIKDRMDLMKSYKKANPKMSYSDMVNDYNTSYQRFGNGGIKDGDKNKEPIKKIETTETPIKEFHLPEVDVFGYIEPERIKNQKEVIQKNNPKNNYGITDKKDNKIYYYNPQGKLILSEDVITGKSNNDVDQGLSMKDWFKKTGSTNHEDYFKYLEQNKYQTTPSGVYNISGVKEDTATDPNKIGRFINFFRPERAKEIRDSRIRDYGEGQKMLTLKSEYGVGSSKAMHGTANPVRVDAFNTQGSDKNLSNGCINVNGQTRCFDLLGKDSSMYILPEENENILYPVNREDLKGVNVKNILETKKRIKESLLNSKLPVDEDRLNFLTSVAEKETKGGRSLNAKIQDYLPNFLAHSKGEFQINPESFKDYLPENYSGDFNDQVKSVNNFYDKNKKELVRPDELYQKYSGDTYGNYSDKFNKIYNTSLKAYKYGGKMPKLTPRNFAKEKANYEEQTRGASQADGSGMSSAELAYKFSKLIAPPGGPIPIGAAISGVEIAKNYYNNEKQDPFDYLGLLKIPYAKEGVKQIPKLTKQLNKLSIINNTVGKTNDIVESYKYGGMRKIKN